MSDPEVYDEWDEEAERPAWMLRPASPAVRAEIEHPEWYARPEQRAWPEQDPKPVYDSRTQPMMPIPRPVVLLIKEAAEAGFEVRTGYALAPIRAVKIGTYRKSESWAVWLGHHPETGARACALYERDPDGKTGWGWKFVSVWDSIRTFSGANRTELKTWLKAKGRPGDLWFRAVRRRIREAEAKRKATPTRRKTTESGG